MLDRIFGTSLLMLALSIFLHLWAGTTANIVLLIVELVPYSEIDQYGVLSKLLSMSLVLILVPLGFTALRQQPEDF
ncbi:hypothetical protein [Thalassotalea marina]|uniref:Uncharacterized protein n=1 Tax=Thalassotalea marina TaxID=1673741 RepID=A0A919EPI6_9GAMM|nr:hypothetical protein [Thalassotalea marina]GHG06473.1 hypothetical protein GCM10017161_40160 [Thalassotalea marina]